MTRTLAVALVTLGDPGRLTGGYLYHRRLAERAAAHDASITFFSVRDRPFPWYVTDGPRVVQAATRSGTDIVVLDSIVAAAVGPYLAVRAPTVPLVGMLHQPPGGIDHGPLRTIMQARLDRLAYRRVVRLLVASESLANELIGMGKPIAVVPPGRDVAAAPGHVTVDLRAGRRAALLCVGNWVERKGILSLLEAFSTLEPEAATLHLAGDVSAEPRYRQRVEARLARADLRNRVVVHGPLSIEAVAAMYAAADAFVLPSLKEPYGTVYGEAMAFGLPVIGWRAGNLPFLAEHEREGLLIEPGDQSGLAAALRRIAEDADLRERLGAAAKRRALARPTWDDVARLFFDHLRDVVAGSQASVPA